MSDLIRTCPNCGGVMVYDPQNGTLACPSCQSTLEPENLTDERVKELPLDQWLEEHPEANEATETLGGKCVGCGAEFQLPENVVAGLCPYCRTPVNFTPMSQRSLRPQCILPFNISREQAEIGFKEWLKNRWFLPKAAKNAQLKTAMTGVYRPLWTFDFKTSCYYTGERGDERTRTRTRTVNGKSETYTETYTVWTDVSGHVYNVFDDLVVNGTTNDTHSLQNEINSWEITSAVDYNPQIIQGFQEENYDLPLEVAFEAAQDKAKSEIEDTVKRDIGGDSQRVSTMDISYSDKEFRLMLAPFWQSEYRYKNKDYHYIVNGQNGSSHGERPWDGWKIFFVVLLSLGAISAALYFLYVLSEAQGV